MFDIEVLEKDLLKIVNDKYVDYMNAPTDDNYEKYALALDEYKVSKRKTK